MFSGYADAPEHNTNRLVYTHIYTRTHVHACAHTHTCTRVRAHTHIHMKVEGEKYEGRKKGVGVEGDKREGEGGECDQSTLYAL